MDPHWQLEAAKAQVEIEVPPYRVVAKLPRDHYHALVYPPFRLIWLDAGTVREILRLSGADFHPDRVSLQLRLMLKGDPIDLPVVVGDSDRPADLEYVDGRHRSAALLKLGASLLPMILGGRARAAT